MLGKLIKHEWLSTWKVPTILCIYLGILTILGCISFLSPMWKTDNYIISIVAVLSLLLYILSLFAISITIFVYFIVRFYRNMYTNEGYLTHTLPVKPGEHIFAKGLIYFIWMLITVIAMICSIALLIITAISSVDGDIMYIIWDALHEVSLSELNILWHETFGMSLGAYLFIMIVTSIISLIYAILMIYTSISIGQLFNKHKVLASFVAYAAINFVIQIISSIIQIPTYKLALDSTFVNNNSFSSVFSYSIFSSVILSVVFTIVFAFVTEYITRKKLNLE